MYNAADKEKAETVKNETRNFSCDDAALFKANTFNREYNTRIAKRVL